MKWESPKPFRFLCKCPLLEVVMNSLSRRYGENSDVLVSTSLHILWIWSLPRRSNLKNEVIGQIVFQFEWGYGHSVWPELSHRLTFDDWWLSSWVGKYFVSLHGKPWFDVADIKNLGVGKIRKIR